MQEASMWFITAVQREKTALKSHNALHASSNVCKLLEIMFIYKWKQFFKSHFVSWIETPVWHILNSSDCSDTCKTRRKKISSRALWDVSVNSNTAPSLGGCRCFRPVFLSLIDCSASPLSPVFLLLTWDTKCTPNCIQLSLLPQTYHPLLFIHLILLPAQLWRF